MTEIKFKEICGELGEALKSDSPEEKLYNKFKQASCLNKDLLNKGIIICKLKLQKACKLKPNYLKNNDNILKNLNNTMLYAARQKPCDFGVIDMLLALGAELNATSNYNYTPMHYACINGNSELIESLLKKNSDLIKAVTEDYNTPLHYASHLDAKIFKLIVDKYIDMSGDINKKNHLGNTILHAMLVRDSQENVEILLQKNDISINAQNEMGLTPLYIATERGLQNTLKILLKQENINVNLPDKYGDSPLHIAVKKGHKEIVNLLLQADKININELSLGKRGKSPLHIAVEKGYIEIIDLLLKQDKIEVNLENAMHEMCLHKAVELNYDKIVDLLLKNKQINPNVDNNSQYNSHPLHMAINNATFRYNNLSKIINIIKSLLNHKMIDVNAINKLNFRPSNQTTLHALANVVYSLNENCYGDIKQIIELLLSNENINPNLQDSNGDTPLHTFIDQVKYDTGIYECLFTNEKVNVNIKNNKGEAPIHRLLSASCINNNELEKLLSNKSVDVVIKNKCGDTPLHLLAKKYTVTKQLESILSKVKASDVNIYNNNGYTPLDTAINSKYLENVKILLQNGANITLKSFDLVQKHLEKADDDEKNTLKEILSELKEAENVKLIPKEENPIEPQEYTAKEINNAIKAGKLEEVKKMVNKNNANGIYFEPYLYTALENSKHDIADYLIGMGANANLVFWLGDNSYTLLSYAASCGDLGLVKTLIEKGADVELEGHENVKSALEKAVLKAEKSSFEIAKLLLSQAADPNRTNRNLINDLLDTGKEVAEKCKLIRLLIENFGEINDKGYSTPIIKVLREHCYYNNPQGREIIKLFLKQKDIDLKVTAKYGNENHMTPASYALECYDYLDSEIIDLFRNHGVDLVALKNQQDKKSKSSKTEPTIDGNSDSEIRLSGIGKTDNQKKLKAVLVAADPYWFQWQSEERSLGANLGFAFLAGVLSVLTAGILAVVFIALAVKQSNLAKAATGKQINSDVSKNTDNQQKKDGENTYSEQSNTFMLSSDPGSPKNDEDDDTSPTNPKVILRF